jgi:hypothetical protein
MKLFVTRALIVIAASVGIMLAQVGPASATVHEIVGQWCSGREPLGPPGISGGSNANNFAKPLEASGVVTGTVPFTGSAGPGFLVTFNYDRPNVKVVPTGVIVVADPSVPLYIELIAPSSSFAAFKHCPRLTTG